MIAGRAYRLWPAVLVLPLAGWAAAQQPEPSLRPEVSCAIVAEALGHPTRTAADPPAPRKPISLAECLSLALGHAQLAPAGTKVSVTSSACDGPPAILILVPPGSLSGTACELAQKA